MEKLKIVELYYDDNSDFANDKWFYFENSLMNLNCDTTKVSDAVFKFISELESF
jgi:hypothetical protein